MPQLLWDASALAKRYTSEAGTETVNALFQLVPGMEMVVTPTGYAETYFILVRKRNEKVLSVATFGEATAKIAWHSFAYTA